MSLRFVSDDGLFELNLTPEQVALFATLLKYFLASGECAAVAQPQLKSLLAKLEAAQKVPA